MGSIFTAISENILIQQLALAATIVVLLVYRFAASRIKDLPSIPLGLLISYLVLHFAIKFIPDGLGFDVSRGTGVAAAVLLYCAIVRLSFYFIIESWYKLRNQSGVPKITRDLVLMISYAVIFLVVLRTSGGVNLIGLITTSAVLTAVIGLAAQNVLGNVLAGISIQVERPFKIGDWIQYHEYIGKVTSIGWEATRLKTFEDETVIVPNLDMSKSVIRNYSIPTTRHAMKIDVGVEYGVSPGKVKSVLIDMCDKEAIVLKNPKPAVRVLNYGDFAITYQIRFFYDDYGNYPDVRSTIMGKIWYALRRNDIKIPFPIRDVQHRHIERKFEKSVVEDLRAAAAADIDSVPILSPLTQDARALIAKRMSIEEYGDGDIIVRQGDAGDSLFIIHRGSCDVEVSIGGGAATKVASLVPPSFFGEMSLLTGEPRTATVRANGDTVVFSIDKDVFRELIVAHPEVSETMASALAKRQAETSEVVGKQREDQERQASKILSRIKSFFGVS